MSGRSEAGKLPQLVEQLGDRGGVSYGGGSRDRDK